MNEFQHLMNEYIFTLIEWLYNGEEPQNFAHWRLSPKKWMEKAERYL